MAFIQGIRPPMKTDREQALYPRVAIVLVNWNNWQDCVQCIDSLLGMDHVNFHIFVVDNDSQDGSVEKIHSWCASPEPTPGIKSIVGVVRWTDFSRSAPIPCRIVEFGTPSPVVDQGCLISLIRSGGNLGFAGGCNVGIRTAGVSDFSFFWFLNTDTVVDQHCLRHLVERARSSASIGMVGSTVLYYDQPTVLQAQAGARMNDQTGESRHIGEGRLLVEAQANAGEVEKQLAYIFGASMLVSSDLIKRVGLMREDYFLYYEEMDWAMRSRAQFRLGYAPGSLVYHKAGNSSSKNMPLFTANFFYRNRIRFLSRFFPQHLNAAKRQFLLIMLKSVAKGRWAEARLIASILCRVDTIARDAIDHQPAVVLP